MIHYFHFSYDFLNSVGAVCNKQENNKEITREGTQFAACMLTEDVWWKMAGIYNRNISN